MTEYSEDYENCKEWTLNHIADDVRKTGRISKRDLFISQDRQIITLKDANGFLRQKAFFDDKLVYKSVEIRPSIVYNGDYFLLKIMNSEKLNDSDIERLVSAFSKVLEYHPFCRYLFPFSDDDPKRIMVYEWNKEPEKRYKALLADKEKYAITLELLADS